MPHVPTHATHITGFGPSPRRPRPQGVAARLLNWIIARDEAFRQAQRRPQDAGALPYDAKAKDLRFLQRYGNLPY